MSKYTVFFTARKGSQVGHHQITVECRSEREAIKLAEIKGKGMYPLHRDYDWGAEKIVKK
jgi:hypothetical protein